MRIPFVDLKSQYRAMKPQINARMDAVLEHGQYIMGPEVSELEQRLCGFAGAHHCITVASGTEALLISLMALGVGPGDEVITTPFSFIATAEVIALLGAIPVFVDIEAATCNIDSGKILESIGPRTKAIMPVSLFGQPANMREINDLAEQNGGIPVIEDAAQSFGATYEGKRSCNLSTIGCTSFFPSKPLGCYGDGGAIFTSDAEIAQRCREIRVHGQSERYVHNSIGVGGRMDTLQCAVVLAKLEFFEHEIEKRQEVAGHYHELIGEPVGSFMPLPLPGADRTSAFAQFSVLVEDRDHVQAFLKNVGIPTAVHYPRPISEQPAYQKFSRPGLTPIASGIARRILSLPMFPTLSERDQGVIVDYLKQAVCT